MDASHIMRPFGARVIKLYYFLHFKAIGARGGPCAARRPGAPASPTGIEPR
jgi:hypothetical protein